MKQRPFPQLTTERLILRKIQESDSEEIFFLRSDKTINQYIERPEERKTKNIADALTFIQMINDGFENDSFVSWGIALKGQPEIIGSICLWNFSKDRLTAEVGYDLKPAFHGKGIMSEALRSVLEFGFQTLNLNKVEAFTQHLNEASRKLLEKNGFALVANWKDPEYPLNVRYKIEKQGH